MIGRTISHYKILEKLGEGGMGVVYKAEDLKLKRTVTLKFLSTQELRNDKEKTRFLHEAQAAAALDHSNICTVYEIDEQDGHTFIVMAFVEGIDLRKKVKERPFALDEALNIIIQATEGLEAAHARNIIHRDIKSANIILSPEGQAKIMDFGLAKLTGQTRVTKTGAAVGTIAYMSPEQAQGEDIDERSDIYSLGVVMYEIITGELPFPGDNDAAILYRLINTEPEPLSHYRAEIPDAVQVVLDKVLAKDPDDRYQSASELRSDLRALMRDLGFDITKAIGTGELKRPARVMSKRMTIAVGVIILSFLLLLVPAEWGTITEWLGRKVIPNEKHLLVLPFTNVGDLAANQAFCDGVMETLTSKINQLEQFQGSLWVVPSSEVRKSNITSASEARTEFGVNLVISGSVQQIGDRFRVILNLIDAKTLRQINSLVIDDAMSNILVLQDATGIKMAEMLKIELLPRARQILTAGHTAVSGAYEYYLQGKGYLQRYHEEESIDKAIALFEQSIGEDSLFALAYAGLGEAFWKKYELEFDTLYVDQAKSYCDRALHINRDIAPVHVTLGIINKGTGKYEEAVSDFTHAISIDPASYEATLALASAYTELGHAAKAESTYKHAVDMRPDYWSSYSHLGVFYLSSGRLEESIKMFEKIIELMPDNIRAHNNLIAVYYMAGRLDEAIEMCMKSIAIKPNADAYSNMGTIFIYQGRYDEAIPVLEGAVKMGANEHEIWANLADAYRYTPEHAHEEKAALEHAIELALVNKRVNPKDAKLHSSIAMYYAKYGDTHKALAEMNTAMELAPKDVTVLQKCVIVNELSGKRDEAFRILERSLELGMAVEELTNEPELVSFREDPRFRKLLDAFSLQPTE